MKRRKFGLLAGTGLAAATVLRPASAKAAPDASLLSTTLTPLGAERAGNADNSIPAWTGGLVSAPLPVSQPVCVQVFTDEAPLYTIDAGNMAQYKDLLTPATQFQVTKYGLSIKVYPTHRTVAAPQYVYDNTAKNVATAKFNAQGGRFGFGGAYGGVPFPIIDSSDPQTAGTQLIWNHLTAWVGYSLFVSYSPGGVVTNGQVSMTGGGAGRTIYPYYDPNGSLETFDGYYSKIHTFTVTPSSAQGSEFLVWHSCNYSAHTDIAWELLTGQGRVRKAPDEQFDTPTAGSNGIANIDENTGFYGDPQQYDWTLIGKQEMLVPYNTNAMVLQSFETALKANFPDPAIMRWEKHRVWVVEATLHPGVLNVNVKRRFYLDEDSWSALLGEGYDGDGNMVKAYANYLACIPSMPGMIQQASATFDLRTGDYFYEGTINDNSYKSYMYLGPQPAADFDPQAMAANASF